MEIILHIGIHKTGTSSIQNFCARNLTFLRDRGIGYVFEGNLSPRNVNFLGAYVTQGRLTEVYKILNDGFKKAEQMGLSRVLLSAESLFAMSTFFPQFGTKSENDYWSRESEYIGALKSMLAANDVRVVCYVRRQDEFIESLYNQVVKQPKGYTGPIQEFLDESNKLLDYHRHIEMWARYFGDRAITVRVFNTGKNIVPDFLKNMLGVTGLPNSDYVDVHVNERLSRDVLEFKRELNNVNMSPVRQFMAYRAVLKVSEEIGEGNGGLLTFHQRRTVVDRYRNSNVSLIKRWLEADETVLSTSAVEERGSIHYEGLTDKRREEIKNMYDQLMKHPATVMEILVRTFFRAVERYLPGGKVLVQPLRRISYKRQIHHEWKSK